MPPPRAASTRRPVLIINGDMPLITGEAIAGARRGARREPARRPRWRRWSSRTRRATGASCAAPTAASSGSSRPRPPATPREEELAIREVNAGLYPFDGGALLEALGGSTPTTPRASSTCPTCCRSCAPPDRVAHLTRRRPRPRARRQHASRPRRGRPRLPRRRIHERTCAPASRSSTRRATQIDAGVTIGQDTTSSLDVPARHDRSAPLRDRAADHADRLDPGRRGSRSGTPTSTARRPTASRSARSPTCARADLREREGRRVRGDQELRPSAPARRSRTCPTSATPTSARGRTSAPARSPPTTTAASSTARRSARRRRRRHQLVAPVTVGDDAYTGAGS